MMIQINAVQTLLVPLRLTCEVFCSLRSPKSPKLFSGAKFSIKALKDLHFATLLWGNLNKVEEKARFLGSFADLIRARFNSNLQRNLTNAE